MVIKLNWKYIVIIISFILIFALGLFVILNNKTKEIDIVNAKFTEIEVKDVFVYGTHLNFKVINNKLYENINGDFTINNNVVKSNVKLNTLDEYTLSKYINEGIYLEDIDIGEYYLLCNNLKLKCDDNFENIEYYTFKDENDNCNLINIFLDEENYLKIKCEKIKIPDDVYDIVIDPGHGGSSTGAVNGKYKESMLTLDYSSTLKEELEKIGYKVKLTREKDVNVDPYGEDGRVGISYDSKAKYFLSIHFNSNDSEDRNGFELYCLNNINLDFARNIVNNMIGDNIKYSNNDSCKYEDGIYIRTFNEEEIEDMDKKYNISVKTPYYFMLRETGGFMTRAFKEMYKDLNYGAESYLFELGYISNNDNLDYILNNKDEYIKRIVKSFKELKKSN